jgi:hypothetical protein
VTEERLDIVAPSPEVLMALGAINLLWASVESSVSAALFSVLEMDERDFTILIGRLEIIPKLKKLEQIMTHRGDSRTDFVKQAIARVNDLRPDRNAVTHGVYQGKTKKGEHVFFLMADLMLDEEVGSARKMRVFADQELGEHASKTLDLLTSIEQAFDSKNMRKLFEGSFRVPTKFR